MKVKLKTMRIIIVILSALLAGVSSFSVINVISQGKSEYMVEFVTNTNSELSAVYVEKNSKIGHLETPVKEGYTFRGWYLDEKFTNKFNKDYNLITKNASLYGKWDINQYYIIFETNGGTSINSKLVNYGDQIDSIEEVTKKEGYEFAGWYLDAETVNPFSGIKVKDHTKLYAKWNPKGFVITFDANGGSAVDTLYPGIEEEIPELPVPERYGYDFTGWYLEENPDELYLSDIVADRNYNFVAKWEKVEFTVSFETNKSNLTLAPLQLKYLAEITVNPPEYPGYSFKGWYLDKNFNTRFVAGSLIEKDIVLYAKWEEITHKVHFETNGGNPVASLTVIDNEKINPIPTPKREGYQFKGWFSDPGLLTPFSNDERITKDYILYAKWEINKYTITYVLNNDSSNITITQDYATSIIRPENPVREGYTFTGWDKETPAVMPAENITISAAWKINEYTVDFITAGGDPVPSEKLYKFGEYFKMDEPISRKTGYTLQGWYKDTEDLNSKWNFTDPYRMVENVKLYALWIPNIYRIQYFIDDKLYQSQNLEYNEHINLLVPEKAGFLFIEWQEGEEAFTLKAMPDRDIKLYARWSALTFSISFFNINSDPIEYDCGAEIGDLPMPERFGFRFLEWYLDADATKPFNIDIMPAYNLMLYARWEVNAATIGFDTNGGTSIPAIVGEVGSPVTAPDEPQKEGYIFSGWYEDKALTKPYEFTTIPLAGIVLYAKWQANSYAIRFTTYSSNIIDDIVLEVDGIIPILPVPIKEGYVFSGWYLDEHLTVPFTLDVMPAHNLNLYAKWGITIFKIVFEEEYGIATILARYGDPVTAPADPVKPGYVFSGWYTDRECTEKFLFATMPEHHVYLFAKWVANRYTVSFNTSGGTPVASFTVVCDKPIVFDDVTIKTGNTFAGWYLNSKYTQPFYMNSLMPANNITLYAKWDINRHKAVFHDFEIKEIYYDYNSLIDYVPAAREGHTFLGWFSDPAYLVPALQRMPDEEIHLYGKWQINKYTITLNSNGGTVFEPITDDYNQTIIIPNPNKEGHSFIGWYEDPGFTVKFTLIKMPARNITLYAKWEINTYKISFVSNGGTFVSDIFYDFNAEIDLLPDIEKIGHTFKGWYADSSFTSLFTLTTMPSSDLRVYAGWEINQYTISFDSKGGSLVSSITKDFDSRLTEPAKPLREGYTFKGWYIDEEMLEGYNFIKMPAENILLYAKWEINTYKLVFRTNIGTIIPDRTYQYNDYIDVLPVLTEYGSVFLGWYTEDEVLFTVPDNHSYRIKNNIELHAKWQKGNYTITFTVNGGSEVFALTQPFNSLVYEPSAPFKDKYEFAGWYTEEGFINIYIFDRMPGENITLYAKWERTDPIAVVFIPNNGEDPDEFLYPISMIDEDLELITVEKTGHTFKGWFTDEQFNKAAPATLPDYDLTLYAEWEINKYTIIFNSNGGSAVAKITKNYDALVSAPAKPTKTGYTFAGWFLDGDFTEPYVFDRMPAENILLYAEWEVNKYTITFDSNGGSPVDAITADYNTDIIVPPNPTMEGYDFTGWYLNGEEYLFDTMPAKNLRLVAGWNMIPVLEYLTDGNDYYLLEHETVILKVRFSDDDIKHALIKLATEEQIHFLYLFPDSENPLDSSLNGITAIYYPDEHVWLITFSSTTINDVLINQRIGLLVELEDMWGHKVFSQEKIFTFDVNKAPVIQSVTPSGTIAVGKDEGFEYEIVVKDDDLFIMRLDTTLFGRILIYADASNPYGNIQNQARLNSQGIFISYTEDILTGISTITISFGADITYYASTLVEFEFAMTVEDSVGNQSNDKQNYTIIYN
ncbi:MAG: InlB B-repeat-containing protein [Bacilli bacterium]|nr:InlB B-repeat-containing protein [Bacilli bacterium]